MSRHLISSFLLLNQHLQQFECMVPIILEKAWDTREHAQRSMARAASAFPI